MGLVMLGSGITSVIFTNILLAEEEEGVASFKTLETPPAGVTPTAMTVSWSYPLDEEPYVRSPILDACKMSPE